MLNDNFTGVTVGTVTALSPTHATVREPNGTEWQVPRAHVPATVAVGVQVTLCALVDGGSRDELARALLERLLGSPEARR